MRILQLIDTLEPGGAEHMAINYANALLASSVESYLCVTRKEGSFKQKLHHGVHYHYIKKRSALDIMAFLKLRRIIKNQKIDLVHAHGSSWFFAILCNFSGIKFKMVWHDHYGNSEFLNERKLQPLQFFSNFFDGIITVNHNLLKWSKEHLNCNKVVFLNNFIIEGENSEEPSFLLKGEARFNLICVANLRPQKDHLTLLKMLKKIRESQEVALHLIGKDFNDSHSSKLIELFENSANVYYYGEHENILPIIKQADIGILSSRSEGLPLVLLEYGLVGLPVICTNVGQCKDVVRENAILVIPGDSKLMASAVLKYLKNKNLRKSNGEGLKRRILDIYSEKSVIPKYLEFCREL